MENKKVNFASIAEKAGKGTKNLLGKAKEGFVKVADQNDDGNFDLKDVSAIAGTISTAAKNTMDTVKANIEEKNRETELRMLHPIFAEDIDSADFMLTKLIRITTMDKRRAESEVCKGSIGYISDLKDLTIVNIYRDKLNLFGLSFYPDDDYGLYYVDPSDRDSYIALDDYFNYLKVARVNELQKIAQDLGAKHFKVTYKEQKASFSSNVIKASVQAAKNISSGAEHNLTSSSASAADIAAEMDCPGHEPIEPTLRYLQRDPSIQSLIALRLSANATSHQKLTIHFSSSSGIKENDAVKIDAALKSLKISGNTTVTSEAKNESRRFFEYEVDF